MNTQMAVTAQGGQSAPRPNAAIAGEVRDTQPWPSRRSACYSLGVMTVVVMFATLDRQMLALLIDPIKKDFHVSDTQVALLLGAAFSITYGLTGIPIARIADTWNRRNLIAISVGFWGACTLLGGIAQSYTHMFLARLGLGVGESGYGPAAWSIAADNWPREKLGLALGIMGTGAMMGIGLSSFTGGAILHFAEHLPSMHVPFVGTIRPWQWTFLVVGLPALLWSIMVMSTREPPRRGLGPNKKVQSVPVRDVARWVLDDWRTYLAVIGGSTMKIFLAAGHATWGATLYHRQFGWELSRVGLITGTITLIVSPIGMIIGGKLSERWTKQGRPDANLRIVLYGLSCSVPLLTIAPLLPNPYMILSVNGMAIFIAALGMGPAFAATQSVTPNRIRAQIGALSQFSTNVIAFALSPLVVALFTDYLFEDPSKLRYSIALNAAVMGALAVLVTFQGLKPYARSYARGVQGFPTG